MKDSTRVRRGPRPATSPIVRAAAAVTAAAALILLVTACSSGSTSSSAGSSSSSGGIGGAPRAGGSTSSPSAVAYSACMRSHGVPNFPDPGTDAAIPKGDARHFGVGTAQLQAAQSACQYLLPAGVSLDQQTEQCMSTGNCPPALVQQVLDLERNFARCMRSHGLPHWPDPTVDPQGRPIFVISITRDLGGVDPHEPQISSKEDECGRLTGSPEPREVNP